MTRISRPLAALGASGLFLLSMVLAGCSDGRPTRVPVSGRVMIDGKPLPAGFIQVCPANQRAATGAIGKDGRFQLTTFDTNDGCVLGKHHAMVEGREDKGPTAVMWHAPRKYANINTSGLEVQITGPTDSLEIKLTWGGGKPFMEYVEGENLGGKRIFERKGPKSP